MLVLWFSEQVLAFPFLKYHLVLKKKSHYNCVFLHLYYFQPIHIVCIYEMLLDMSLRHLICLAQPRLNCKQQVFSCFLVVEINCLWLVCMIISTGTSHPTSLAKTGQSLVPKHPSSVTSRCVRNVPFLQCIQIDCLFLEGKKLQQLLTLFTFNNLKFLYSKMFPIFKLAGDFSKFFNSSNLNSSVYSIYFLAIQTSTASHKPAMEAAGTIAPVIKWAAVSPSCKPSYYRFT